MSVPIAPLPKYILAKPVEVEAKTASGIYIPESATEKSNEAIVKAIGKDIQSIKVGDRIIYKSYSSNDYKKGSESFIFVKEEDVLGTVK